MHNRGLVLALATCWCLSSGCYQKPVYMTHIKDCEKQCQPNSGLWSVQRPTFDESVTCTCYNGGRFEVDE